MLTGKSYPVVAFDVIGGKARLQRIFDLGFLQLFTKDQRGREGRIFGESIDSPSMRGEVFDPAQSLLKDAERNITLTGALVGQLNHVEDEGEAAEEFIELGEVLAQQRILALIGDEAFILLDPFFEFFFGLNREVEPRDRIELIALRTEVMEVGMGEFLEDIEEAIFGIGILVGIDQFERWDLIGVDQELKALESAVCGEADLGIAEVLSEFGWLDASKE
jgi:hypothetical protein